GPPRPSRVARAGARYADTSWTGSRCATASLREFRRGVPPYGGPPRKASCRGPAIRTEMTSCLNLRPRAPGVKKNPPRAPETQGRARRHESTWILPEAGTHFIPACAGRVRRRSGSAILRVPVPEQDRQVRPVHMAVPVEIGDVGAGGIPV